MSSETPVQGTARAEVKRLYISFAADDTAQIGTCRHCVVEERGRTADSKDPDPQRSELDFPLDELLRRFAAKGLRVEIVDQSVCP